MEPLLYNPVVVFFKGLDAGEIVFARDRDQLWMNPVIDSESRSPGGGGQVGPFWQGIKGLGANDRESAIIGIPGLPILDCSQQADYSPGPWTRLLQGSAVEGYYAF